MAGACPSEGFAFASEIGLLSIISSNRAKINMHSEQFLSNPSSCEPFLPSHHPQPKSPDQKSYMACMHSTRSSGGCQNVEGMLIGHTKLKEPLTSKYARYVLQNSKGVFFLKSAKRHKHAHLADTS